MHDLLTSAATKLAEQREAQWMEYLTILRHENPTDQDASELVKLLPDLNLPEQLVREHAQAIEAQRELAKVEADELSRQPVGRHAQARSNARLQQARGDAHRARDNYPHLFDSTVPSPHTLIGLGHWHCEVDRLERLRERLARDGALPCPIDQRLRDTEKHSEYLSAIAQIDQLDVDGQRDSNAMRDARARRDSCAIFLRKQLQQFAERDLHQAQRMVAQARRA